LVEIMADISKSKINGLPLENYNHKPIKGASVVADAERQKNINTMYDRLRDTNKGAQEQLQKDLKGKTKEQVAAYFNITVEDAQELRYDKGGFVDIDSFMNNSDRGKYNPN
jgi:DNA-directed RNA polymerase specialized sigma subunit